MPNFELCGASVFSATDMNAVAFPGFWSSHIEPIPIERTESAAGARFSSFWGACRAIPARAYQRRCRFNLQRIRILLAMRGARKTAQEQHRAQPFRPHLAHDSCAPEKSSELLDHRGHLDEARAVANVAVADEVTEPTSWSTVKKSMVPEVELAPPATSLMV